KKQIDGFVETLDSHLEWLVVRENGRTLTLLRNEIEVKNANGKTTIGFIDERGLAAWRVDAFEADGAEIAVNISSKIRNISETIRFIPRESAAELRENIELARLEKANEIAEIFVSSETDLKLVRVSLNVQNGRIAQIELEDQRKKRFAAIADVTAGLTHESILATALKWQEELQRRKKNPIRSISVIAEKRQARALQKLLALLNKGASESISIYEIDRRTAVPIAKELRRVKMSELWRERAKKLRLPETIEPSETARKIIEMSPEKIDRVVSRNGETLRFLGMPFARVRTMSGREKAWFGTGKAKRPITESAKRSFRELRVDLDLHRRFEPPNRRHDSYRLASEAWLESILRRNIKLLDPNLILSPIYNQFRSSNDKIDLLAIRRDGRLVIIEIKTSPDRDMIFQAADYWCKIELQRRRGVLAEARLFGSIEIIDKPALIYAVAPALSFHYDFEFFARMLSPEIELWRWELHENWRREIKVISRKNYSESVL
ncbi:MAG: hypothetical protein ACRD6X_15205, partial [Pyrinomonadaceae bacterium]